MKMKSRFPGKKNITRRKPEFRALSGDRVLDQGLEPGLLVAVLLVAPLAFCQERRRDESLQARVRGVGEYGVKVRVTDVVLVKRKRRMAEQEFGDLEAWVVRRGYPVSGQESERDRAHRGRMAVEPREIARVRVKLVHQNPDCLQVSEKDGLMEEMLDEALVEDATLGLVEKVEMWLSAGADYRYRDGLALQRACAHGHAQIVQILLNAGADVDALDGAPVTMAAVNGWTEIVRLLIHAGADIHQRDNLALKAAAAKGRMEVVRLLVESGAHVNTLSKKSPLQLAHENKHSEVAEFLVSRGAVVVTV